MVASWTDNYLVVLRFSVSAHFVPHGWAPSPTMKHVCDKRKEKKNVTKTSSILFIFCLNRYFSDRSCLTYMWAFTSSSSSTHKWESRMVKRGWAPARGRCNSVFTARPMAGLKAPSLSTLSTLRPTNQKRHITVSAIINAAGSLVPPSENERDFSET